MRVKKEDEEEQRVVRKGGGLMARRWIKHGLRKKGKDWSEGGWRRQAGLIHDGRWWAHRWEERGRGVTGAGRGRRRQKVMRKGEKIQAAEEEREKMEKGAGACVQRKRAWRASLRHACYPVLSCRCRPPGGNLCQSPLTHTHTCTGKHACVQFGGCLFAADEKKIK